LEEEVFKVEMEDRVAVCTLNRPENHNSLNAKLMRVMADRMRDVAHDDKVRVVVLTGAGTTFCAGGDLKAINKAADARVVSDAPPPQSTEERVRWLRRCVETARWLHETPKPAIAMINGSCGGAGMSLAAACDMRFGCASSRYRSAFTPMGLSGDYGGFWFWTKILGTAKARQLYLIDEKRDAQQALEFGLIDRIYPDETLREETMKVAHQIAALPGEAAAYAKASLNVALHEPLMQFLDRETLHMVLARNVLVEQRKAKQSS
jgi:2-(1,2-epoxy-1,2-dihydrophenyl)acetyl-CoA isomerase